MSIERVNIGLITTPAGSNVSAIIGLSVNVGKSLCIMHSPNVV